MKKLSAFLLSGLLMLPLAACGNTAPALPNTELPAESQGDSYTVGDIILSDGTLVKPNQLTSIDATNPPVAVIAVLREDGAALGAGVHISDSCLTWASDGEKGSSPAFAFADTYAETYGLNGSYADNWRMPDIEELSAIYENRESVNTSLCAIHELDGTAAIDGLGTNWYWASTPSDTEDDYAWFVHYFNGYAACCPADFDNLHVMAVRVFEGV